MHRAAPSTPRAASPLLPSRCPSPRWRRRRHLGDGHFRPSLSSLLPQPLPGGISRDREGERGGAAVPRRAGAGETGETGEIPPRRPRSIETWLERLPPPWSRSIPYHHHPPPRAFSLWFSVSMVSRLVLWGDRSGRPFPISMVLLGGHSGPSSLCLYGRVGTALSPLAFNSVVWPLGAALRHHREVPL